MKPLEIIIVKCDDCPCMQWHFNHDRDYEYYCRLDNGPGEIEDVEIVDRKCPLRQQEVTLFYLGD